MDMQQETLNAVMEEKGMNYYSAKIFFAFVESTEESRKNLDTAKSEFETAFENYYKYVFNRDYVFHD